MKKSLLAVAASGILAGASSGVLLGGRSGTGKPESGYQRPSSRPRPCKRVASPAERVLLAARERRKGGL